MSRTAGGTTTQVLDVPQSGMAYLKSIEKAIPAAQTEENELGNIRYLNEGLDECVRPLLECLGLKGQGYTAWKMIHSTHIENATGPEHIIPINVLDNTKPDLQPGGLLQPGKYIYHDGPVDLKPSLNCLFVGKPHQSSNS